jgi:membrane protein DedA with SNARE-associated domain
MGYFLSVFIGTFVLEDVALASALALVADNKMRLVPAFLACSLGIGIGDLALYLVGFVVGRLGIENRFKSIRKIRAKLVNEKQSDLLTYSVIISRFIPGTRLPTYLTAGLLRYPFWRFLFLTAVTVLGWVLLAFALGQSLKSILMNHWIVTVIAILFILQIVKSLLPKLSDYWERRALQFSWMRFLSFEFWPATVFYLPIVPYYVFLSLKHRSLLAPFYANPEIANGGLLGESKWSFLKYLSKHSPHTLKALKIGKQSDFFAIRELLDKEGLYYPFIIKPDIGQRGFGVRIIRDDFDLTEYLLLSDFDLIVQRLSHWPCEAGIFYVRPPSQSEGGLFSITDKLFPVVTGDGKTRLGDLILRDRRARIIASTYFSRHRENLNNIPEAGSIVLLSECGNHCQGAIFLNGENLKTPELLAAIQAVVSPIPDFYFGRLDIRYKDAKSLMQGNDFEIVEINGAGSEATHIWDAKTTLRAAYKTLFTQWRLLFEIGDEVRRSSVQKNTKIHPIRFLKECFRVFFRKDPLSVSS